MSEKKFCKSCEYYYSEMFTCPICYGEQRERERITKLLEAEIEPCRCLDLNCDTCDLNEMLTKGIALIKGENK